MAFYLPMPHPGLLARRKPTLTEALWLASLARQHPRYQGCVGHWAMLEDGGNIVYDLSGMGNNGTLTNMDPATDRVIGKFGPALDFDGIDDVVTMGDINALDGFSVLTCMAWVKVKTLTIYRAVCGKYLNNTNGGWGMSLGGGTEGGSDDMFCYVRNGGGNGSVVYTTGNVISTNVWNHWCYVFDGSLSGNTNRIKIYLNGIQQTTGSLGTVPASAASTTAAVTIGNLDEGLPLNAEIEDVRLFLRPLGQAEILDHVMHPWLEWAWAWEQQQLGFVVAVGHPAMRRHGGIYGGRHVFGVQGIGVH